MLSSVLSLALSACVWGQVEAQVELAPQKRREEIAQAVERLADKQFSVREAAGSFLWRQDEAAVPALREAAKSADRETRTRAQRILADIEYGIRHDVAPAEAAWMRTFRDAADVNSQVAVLRKVVGDERIELSDRLIGKLPQPSARQQLLRTVLADGEFVKACLEQKKLDVLLAVAAKEPQYAVRHWMLTTLTQNVAFRRLAEQLTPDARLPFLVELPDNRFRSEAAAAFCNSPTTAGQLIACGRFAAILELVRPDLHENLSVRFVQGERVNAHPLQPMFAGSPTLDLLGRHGQASTLVKLLNGERNDAFRLALAFEMAGRMRINSQPTTAVSTLIDNGHVEELWTIATDESRPKIGAVLIPAILREDKALAWLRKGKDRDALSRSLKDAWIFASPPLMEALAEDGGAELLWRRATESSDVKRRGAYAVHLASVPAGLSYIQRHDRWEAFWRLVAASELTASDSFTLRIVLGNAGAIDSLFKSRILNDLLDPRNDPARDEIWILLIGHPSVARELVRKDGAEAYMKRIAQAEPRLRGAALTSAAANEHLLASLIEGGQLEEMLRLAKTAEMHFDREQLLFHLHLNSKASALLVKRNDAKLSPALMRELKQTRQTTLEQFTFDAGRLREWLKINPWRTLLEMADQVAPPRAKPAPAPAAVRQPTLRQRLLVSPAVVRCVAERGELKLLLDELRSSGDWPWRQPFVSAVLSGSDAGVSPLPLPGAIDAVLQTVRDEPDEAIRRGLSLQLVTQSGARQTLLWNGQEAALRDFVANALPPDRSGFTNRLLYQPTGILGWRLDRQDYDLAEQLLKDDVRSEAGAVRWVSYLAVRGRLVEEIARLEHAPGLKASPDDQRMLMLLHRANGDVPSALKYARRVEPSARLHLLMSESRRWKEAAAHLLATTSPGATTSVAIEAQSYLAAYQRLAGDRSGSLATLKALRDATRDDKTPAVHSSLMQWNVAKTMLRNHQTDQGLALLEKVDPANAFLLYRFRREFAKALRLVGAAPEATLDRRWLDELPAPPLKTNATSAPWPTLSKYELAMEVVGTLRMLGRDDDAETVLNLLRAEFQGNVAKKGVNDDPYVQLAVAIIRVEGPRQAKTIIEQSLSKEQAARVSTELLPRSSNPLPESWLREGRGNVPWSEILETAVRMRTGRFTSSEIDRLIAGRERQLLYNSGRSPSITSRDSHERFALGRLCLQYGCPEQARAHLEKADPTHPGVMPALVEALHASKAWPEAARAAEADYERDRERLLSLYLAGDAWQRAGDKPRGERLKQQASLLAFDVRTRHQLAVDLARFGLTEDALRQHEIVRRVAPIDSWEWHDSLRLTSELMHDADPLGSAEHQEQHALQVANWTRHLSDSVAYVRDPPLLLSAQARADVEAGRFEQAAERIERALEVNPTASIVAERLVPALEAAGRREEADRLFARLYDRLEGIAKAHPRCAVVHNDLAWMSARCRRRLDDALRHAERAVELSPTAAHLDTLAEAYFQRGDREAAIRESRRALELEPRSEHHRRRVEHFEKTPK